MLQAFWRVFTSTLAAFFGVQSEKNRQRDFSDNRSPVAFIAMGVILALLFVLTLIWIVRQVTT